MTARTVAGGEAPPAVTGGEPDPDALAEATLACPDVTALSGGLLGEVATYLPGRRVTGVRVREAVVEVHVVARYGPTMDEIGAQVRAALAPLVGARAVAVTVDDLAVDAGPERG